MRNVVYVDRANTSARRDGVTRASAYRTIHTEISRLVLETKIHPVLVVDGDAERDGHDPEQGHAAGEAVGELGDGGSLRRARNDGSVAQWPMTAAAGARTGAPTSCRPGWNTW